MCGCKGPGTQDAIAAVFDLSARDDPCSSGSAVETETIEGEEVRVRLTRELSVLVWRGVAVDDDSSIKPAAPLQERAMDPSPLRVGKRGPGSGEEFLWLGMRVEPGMDEQRIADRDMRQHRGEQMKDILTERYFEKRSARARVRAAGQHRHFP